MSQQPRGTRARGRSSQETPELEVAAAKRHQSLKVIGAAKILYKLLLETRWSGQMVLHTIKPSICDVVAGDKMVWSNGAAHNKTIHM